MLQGNIRKINSLIKKVLIFLEQCLICAQFLTKVLQEYVPKMRWMTKIKYVEDIFRSIGYIRKISENEMDSFTALFGSGPAYIMYFIESLMKCEKFENISEDAKSPLLIVNMLSSTSKMLLVSEDIKKLRKQVTSEGGTEAAQKYLKKEIFQKL